MIHITTKHRYFLLWMLFVLTMIVGLFECRTLTEESIFDSFKISFLLQLALLLFHAAWTMSWGRSLLLIALIMGFGFTAEVLGVQLGIIFGGSYTYKSTLGMVGGVPMLVLLYWACFVYGGYCISSSFLFWLKQEKPAHKHRNWYLLPLLILLDGLLVVAIDLFMDPMMVKVGNWHWVGGGAYYDIPFGNFFGWFIVVICSTGSFRLYEYFRPQPTQALPYSIFLIPVISYAMLCLVMLIATLSLEMHALALSGFFFMFPIVVSNLLFYCAVRQPGIDRKTMHKIG